MLAPVGWSCSSEALSGVDTSSDEAVKPELSGVAPSGAKNEDVAEPPDMGVVGVPGADDDGVMGVSNECCCCCCCCCWCCMKKLEASMSRAHSFAFACDVTQRQVYKKGAAKSCEAHAREWQWEGSDEIGRAHV